MGESCTLVLPFVILVLYVYVYSSTTIAATLAYEFSYEGYLKVFDV